MKTIMRLFCIAVFSVILFTGNNSYAIPAFPHPIQYISPDGTELTITLKGDEKVHWATSADGYTLLCNSDGYYEYAMKNSIGDLVLSGIRANNVSDRTVSETLFLSTLEQDIRFSHEQIDLLLQAWAVSDDVRSRREAARRDGDGPSRVIGSIRAPVVLVAFPNKPFTRTKAEFELLLNQPNYTSGGTIPGSVYDYFYAVSYQQLQFQVDVYGIFTLSNPIGYYDDSNTPPGDPSLMAREAATAAAAAGCNFSVYDHDNNGYVDCFHVIFAGHGQEAGAPVGQSIWSHAWSIYPAMTLNGKTLSDYSCSPELRNNSGTNITYIGVIAHELSHVFGLPDMYDSDYDGSGGESVDLGKWDIMASGSWNDGGKTPAHHSAWCKHDLGWIPQTELTYPCDVIIPNPAVEGICYTVTTTTANEYFLIENRQAIGWDAFIPSSGMLVYHVNENNPGWNNNCINCNPANRGIYVKQAGGGPGSNNSNQINDPYPYGTNNTFTDTSIPNSKSWANNNTAKPITEITHNLTNRTIFFKFMGGFSDYDIEVLADPTEGGTVSGGGTYESGSIVTVTATPAENYTFINWTQNNTVVSVDPEYTFQATAHRTLVAHFKNNDNSLISLTVSEGTLTPEFDPEILEYSVTLPSDIFSISITGVASHPSASVFGNVTDYPTPPGETLFPIIVTSEDGLSRTYNVRVTRTISDDATLRIINLSDGFLTPSFAPLTTEYVVNVDASVVSMNIQGIPNHYYATVSGNVFNTPISVGENVFPFVVVAEDGITTMTYTVTVIRPISNDATLRELNLSVGMLTPPFSPLQTEYSVNVTSENVSIDITGIPNHPNATLVGNVTNAGLAVGTTSFSLTVTAEDGVTTMTYTVHVNRAVSNDATLQNIILSEGTLDPIFYSAHTEYLVIADFATTQISITGIPNHPNATVSGNVTNVPLNLGSNYFNLVVTAEDGTTTMTYTVNIRRALSNNALLASLTISAGSMYPVFTSGITLYTITVNENVSTISFTGVPVESDATVEGNMSYAPLSIGMNFFTIVVTAPDLVSIKEYTLIVNRARATHEITASLEGEVLGGVITPEGVSVVPDGENITYTITPNIFHKIKSVKVDDIDQGPIATFTFNNVTTDHTIAVRFVDINDGIDAIDVPQLTVFPNPTTGELNIENYTLGIDPIQLYDLSGRAIFETRDLSFNIAHLAAGVYILKIDHYRVKLIKQ